MKPINEKSEGDCGYICMYKGKRCEVYAQSTYTARQIAAKHFKAKKPYEVDVYLAERANGTDYIRTATE